MYSCAATSGPKLFCMFGLFVIVSSILEPRCREAQRNPEERAAEKKGVAWRKKRDTAGVSAFTGGINAVPLRSRTSSAKRFTHGVHAQ